PASLIALTRRILLHPFLLAQRPGSEHVGQALRFCLSDFVKMKVIPARTCTARETLPSMRRAALGAAGLWAYPADQAGDTGARSALKAPRSLRGRGTRPERPARRARGATMQSGRRMLPPLSPAARPPSKARGEPIGLDPESRAAGAQARSVCQQVKTESFSP